MADKELNGSTPRDNQCIYSELYVGTAGQRQHHLLPGVVLATVMEFFSPEMLNRCPISKDI